MDGESIIWDVHQGFPLSSDYCIDDKTPENYFTNVPVLRFTLRANSLENSTLDGLPHVHTGTVTPNDWRHVEYNWLGSTNDPDHDPCGGLHTKHAHFLLSQIPIRRDA